MKNIIFGVLVVVAMFLACELAYRRGRRMGLNTRYVVDASLWAVFGGFAVSHVVAMAVYHPDLLMKNPLSLLVVWGGMSSYGGFFGGAAGVLIFLKWKKAPFIPYSEALLFGIVPAWILGRLGCTITFDHPGTPTDFFLGMADAAGVVRHNLGFYEMLWTIVITVVLYGLRNRYPFPGFHAVLVIFLYTPVRFYFDTLRIADVRYFGMTPGQYFSIAFFLIGVSILLWGLSGGRSSKVK